METFAGGAGRGHELQGRGADATTNQRDEPSDRGSGMEIP